MNLIVDIGNTRAKIAVFENNELHEVEAVEYKDAIAFIKSLQVKYSITAAIISNVGNPQIELEEYLASNFEYVKLSSNTPIPVKINYATPATLGVDRRALAVAADEFSKDKSVLVIDMGSCITYDYIEAGGIYHGGAISPGVNMRFKAMHNFTESLPLVSIKDSDSPIGKTTEMSLVNGVLYGVKGEIDSYISQIKELDENILVIITGGDHPFFVNKLKNSIFADSKILLKGLNSILNYNISKIDE